MKKYRALVVEDDEDLGTIFSTALRSMEFTEVVLIADGAKALAWLAEHEPDLVVLDLHLPKLSGVNLLRQITQEMRLLNTRVMVVTADTDMAEELRNKADLVLVKPVTFTQIRELAGRLVPGAAIKEPESQPSSPVVETPVTPSTTPPATDVTTPPSAPSPASPPPASGEPTAPAAPTTSQPPVTGATTPPSASPPASQPPVSGEPTPPSSPPPVPATQSETKEPDAKESAQKDTPPAAKP